MVYPLSLFNKSGYCVVWGPEEHAARETEGWSAEDVREATVEPVADQPAADPPAKKRRGKAEQAE